MSKHDEASVLKRLFNKMDTNRDHFISGIEFQNGFTPFPELKVK